MEPECAIAMPNYELRMTNDEFGTDDASNKYDRRDFEEVFAEGTTGDNGNGVIRPVVHVLSQSQGVYDDQIQIAKLLGVPYVLILFIVTFIDSTIHNGYFVVIDGFLQKVGISANMSMVVSSIGQVAEIVTMVILGTVLKKLGWKTTLIIGILGHAARFGVFAFFGSPDHAWLIIAIQVLHGICYAFYFVTVYIFVDAVFPKDVRSSASEYKYYSYSYGYGATDEGEDVGKLPATTS